METNTQNEMAVNDMVLDTVNSATDMLTQPVSELSGNTEAPMDINDPRHPEHPEHHKHISALHAASLTHSAVHHVMPHHRGIDL